MEKADDNNKVLGSSAAICEDQIDAARQPAAPLSRGMRPLALAAVWVCAFVAATSSLVAAAIPLPQASPAACPAAVSIVNTSVTFFPVPKQKDTFAADILFKNDGPVALTNGIADFDLVTFDGRSLQPLRNHPNLPGSPGNVQDVQLSVQVKQDDLPVSGFVVVGASATGVSCDAKSVALAIAIPSSVTGANSFRIVFFSAAAGLVAFVIAIAVFHSGLAMPMGAPDWSFSGSAVTNLTVAGTLLSGVLLSTAVPDNPHYLGKQGYIVLSLLFTVVAGLAPVFYNFCSTPTGPDPANLQSLEFEGSVWLFLLSAALTIWAVLGQLATMSVMFQEFAAHRTISRQSAWAEWAVAGGVGVSILVYCYRCADYYVNGHPARLPAALKAGLSANVMESMTSRGAPRWTAL